MTHTLADIRAPGALVGFFVRLDAGERLPFAEGTERFTIEKTGKSYLLRDASGDPLGCFTTFAEAWAARPRSTLPEGEAAA